MPAEVSGSYVFYDTPDTRKLEIALDATGQFSGTTLGGRPVQGSVDIAGGTYQLRLELPLGAATAINVRSPGKRVYEGMPLIGKDGKAQVNSRNRLWGWAGTYHVRYERERVGAVRPPSGGWWARLVTGFAADVLPLFRQKDIDDMNSVVPESRINLASHTEVSSKAYQIYYVVGNPTPSFVMPCDGAWPKSKVDMFGYWIEDGRLP